MDRIPPRIVPLNRKEEREMEQEIITVNLYGGKGIFGGKETPLEASVVYCDRHSECSYYNSGSCLNVRAPFSNRCKYGRVSNITGYTSRAAKYYEFKSKWKGHEKYGKLSYPPRKLGLIGNEVVFPYPYARIKESDGKLFIESPGFGSDIAYVDYDKFTTDFIIKLCDFRPYAMMGGVITAYQKEVVPLFLAHLKEVLPEKYAALLKFNSDIVKEINYVGRKALLKTTNPSCVSYESRPYPQFDESWEWDGEILTRKSGYVHDFSITKDYEVVQIKIRPSDKSIIKITSNEQVNENTVFLD
jgi:hypothetical protein